MDGFERNPNERWSGQSGLGTVLLILGGLALLSNLGLFGGFGRLMTAAMFAAGGVVLLRLYTNHPRHATLVLPSFVLFAIAGAIVGGALAGGLFLAVLGLGFLAVYARDRHQWWAVIPAGVLFTLGLVATFAEILPGGLLLFLGLSATFALLTVLPIHRQAWGIYPALGFAALAVLVLTTSGGWVLPLVLVGAGFYLLSRRGKPAVGSGSGDLVTRSREVTLSAQASPAAATRAPDDDDGAVGDAHVRIEGRDEGGNAGGNAGGDDGGGGARSAAEGGTTRPALANGSSDEPGPAAPPEG